MVIACLCERALAKTSILSGDTCQCFVCLVLILKYHCILRWDQGQGGFHNFLSHTVPKFCFRCATLSVFFGSGLHAYIFGCVLFLTIYLAKQLV